MNPLFLAFGVAVLVAVVLDVLWTTLREGAGWGTRRLTQAAWRVALRIHGRIGSHRLLSLLGVGVVLLAVMVWIGGLWLGWSLVFCCHDGAVIDPATGASASWTERAYFAATTLLSLGPGDFVPRGAGWQLAAALATLSGLFVVTFAVTYLVPVVQAATHKRQVAVFVSSLGQSPLGLLLRSWNGESFGAFERVLQRLIWELTTVEQRHLTYPVLHYLHSAMRSQSLALSVAAVDEAVSILEHGFEGAPPCDVGALAHARACLDSLVKTIGPGGVGDVPPIPSLSPLRDQGVPVVDDEVFAERLASSGERRRRLEAIVELDGWHWEQVAWSRREPEHEGSA